MTWQLASFLLLALALGCGFAWYERSRPPARVLALVAALAALAVVGRLAFAAFPNVKPTTDIVLLSGYALGGVPGFAVGAVTAVVSNVFLTQGPWTPWQMAGWGGVGIAGGALAAVMRGREPGRLLLAAVCGAAGLAFGVVLDVYQWTLAAEQTLPAYLAVSLSSLPYNLAHAAGNVVFCLAFGPAFVRAVGRYRRRFQVRWSPAAGMAAVAGLGVVVVLTLPAAGSGATGLRASDGGVAEPARARVSTSRAGERAAAYLTRHQNEDGGFGAAPGQRSNQLHSGWTALGLAAAGRNPADVERAGRSLIDYVRSQAGTLSDTGELERTILVLRAAGLSARTFAGRDLVAELLRRRRRNGSFAGLVNLTAFGVLALRAAGEARDSARVSGSARWLVRQQNRDGGFGTAPRGSPSDVDDTGAVLQALAAAGRFSANVRRRAVGYLRRAQNPDGGFGQMRRRSSNAQSTAWAVQGLLAAGRDPDRLRRGTRTPLGYLRSLQVSDGSIRYSRTSTQTPVWVTAQALTALERRRLPLAPVRRRGAGAGGATATAAPSPRPRARRPAARRKRGERRRRTASHAPRPANAGVSPRPETPAAPPTDRPAEKPADPSSTEPSAPGAGLLAAFAGAAALAALYARAWRRRRLGPPTA